MNTQKNKYNQLINCIAQKQLKPAFDWMKILIAEEQLTLLNDEYQNIEQTYKYMLQYTLEGAQDPEREKVYKKLILSSFGLADKIWDKIQLKKSSGIDYEKIRTNKTDIDVQQLFAKIKKHSVFSELDALENDNLSATNNKNERAEQYHQAVIKLFDYFWLLNQYKNKDLSVFHQFIDNETIETHYKSLMVSALNLSLLRYFNKEKFVLLLDIMLTDDVEVNQRALVSLILNLYKYKKRITFYNEIVNRLKILNDDSTFITQFETVLIQLIRSRDTEKLQERIQKEIIPEMIKISPTLQDKLNFDSLMEEEGADDENPEWKELFKDAPGLIDKMEEFSELQMEGADVFLSSFSMLKSYPFFNDFTNWLLPFYNDNYQINKSFTEDDSFIDQFINSIDKAPILCNSDKYSFCLSLQQFPEENRQFISQALEAEMGQLEEINKDEELTAPEKKNRFISNQYIQDLYRFFKLHPRKNSFEDIFLWDFNFHNYPIFQLLLNNHKSILRNIGEFYFSKNHYQRAIEIFETLLTQSKDGELYQKVGFSYQKLGQFEKALEFYKKAELFELNKKWNLQKIALCYRNLKQYDKAMKYYKEVEKLNPDNLKNQLDIGHCFLEMEEYDEALKCYFKVEYLAPGNKKVWRPIAWCSFISGKKEQAEKYFMQLIEDNPNAHDLMNMGHVQWSLGNNKAALAYYKQAIIDKKFTKEEFFTIFDEDYPHLIRLGVSKNDVPILLDQLRYSLES